jgi:hypothetical protein
VEYKVVSASTKGGAAGKHLKTQGGWLFLSLEREIDRGRSGHPSRMHLLANGYTCCQGVTVDFCSLEPFSRRGYDSSLARERQIIDCHAPRWTQGKNVISYSLYGEDRFLNNSHIL